MARQGAWGVPVVAAAIGLSSVALAADLPVKAPVAPAAVAYNWSGFYTGVHGGAGWVENRFFDVSGNSETGRFTADGYFGGGQIGYN